MSEPKPVASLGPMLLARKGGARPAMRPQIQPMASYEPVAANQLEDLGWNDMGEEHHHHDNVQPIDPNMDHGPARPAAKLDGVIPPVVRQQEEVARHFAAPASEDSAPAPQAAAPRAASSEDSTRRSAIEDGRRAAFTLRVDARRHLKLRLACTIRNRSAQQIVTEALDLLLDNMPELESLARQVKRK